ncbi:MULTISPECIES: NERD domain-containing protein [unclassified Methylobacterium]|uniref:NERD domain-containing protein n=1 Tax=unclassified Methylobacterium TaxID=2615210 RepID=UPI00226A5DA0|nr:MULTISPECIES: NERD domain-containing protein [unclassified Methylobacterium]
MYFHPPNQPEILTTDRKLSGELAVWNALKAAPFPGFLHVFYNRKPKGSNKPPDFLLIDYARGLFNLEVKGGQVRFDKGQFRQRIKGTKGFFGKKIDPLFQAKRALDAIIEATGVPAADVPTAVMLAAPLMTHDCYWFGEHTHILTSEDLAPDRLVSKVLALLPERPLIEQRRTAPALKIIIDALSRPGDEGFAPG